METLELEEQYFIPNPTYIYKIVPIYSKNLAIEIKDGNTKDGTNIQLGERKDVPYQYFKILKNEQNNYILEPAHCTGSAIDIKDGKMKSRTNIQLFQKNNTNSQNFQIIKGEYLAEEGKILLSYNFNNSSFFEIGKFEFISDGKCDKSEGYLRYHADLVHEFLRENRARYTECREKIRAEKKARKQIAGYVGKFDMLCHSPHEYAEQYH